MLGPVRLSAVFALTSLTCLLPSSLRAAGAETQAELAARLDAVRQASTLHDPALKPWHLKVSFDLLNAKGAVSEQGTLEEWWLAPDRWRSVIASPSYNAEEIQDGEKHFRSRNAQEIPELIRLLREQYDDPVPGEREVKVSSLSFAQQKVGKNSLDCMALRLPQVEDSPTYCFAPGENALRFTTRYNSEEEIIRNQPGRFQGKLVFLNVSMDGNAKPLLTSKLDALSTIPPGSVSLEPGSVLEPIEPPTERRPGVVAGKKTGGQEPKYPDTARIARMQGLVVLKATIDTTGHVQEIRPLWSPGKLLTDSAVDAVRTWTFEPFLLKGQPVKVAIHIFVNYKTHS